MFKIGDKVSLRITQKLVGEVILIEKNMMTVFFERTGAKVKSDQSDWILAEESI